MINSKRDNEIGRALSSLQTDEPGVEIKSFHVAGPGLARVVVDVTHTAASREDHGRVGEAIKHKLQGKMTAVSGSFQTLDRGTYTERITGLLGAVHDVIAVSDKTPLKGFRALAANMFMDDEKDMWVLRKTQSGQVLVKTTGIEDDESLASLLDSVSSAGYRSSPEYRSLCSVSSGAALEVQGGDFVSFVDINNTMRYGFVAATAGDSDDVLMLQPGQEDAESIKVGAVVEKIDQESFPETKFTDEERVNQAISASKGTVDVNMIVEYYKKVFNSNPTFFAEFEKRVRGHAWM